MRWTDEAMAIREEWPEDAEHLWLWATVYAGVRIARRRVCQGHTAPFTAFARQVLARPRPPLALWHASRGGGKSFLSALDTHLTSRWHPRHGSRVLGGSLDQAKQIYNALKAVTVDHEGDPSMGNDADSIRTLLAQSAHYLNGSEVAILACSDRSVRGPHVPSLKLDEVDEIQSDRRDSAMGMCMMDDRTQDIGASVLMTSTWHRPGGPMSGLMDRAASGDFSAYTWCAFEVLERCPTQRSGRWVGGADAFENCPSCPIRRACHADRDGPDDLPKAKRSDGHYRIADLIRQARAVSYQTFRSDFMCDGPKTEGLIYTAFDRDANVSEAAEFNPALPSYLAVDPGVRTGGVLFQVAERSDEFATWVEARVFAEHYAEGLSARMNARKILEVERERAMGRRSRGFVDRSGRARTSIGPVVMAEYEAEGLKGLESWPAYDGSVRDGIALVDSFIKTGDERVALLVHPRCRHVIQAFQTYERSKVGGQWLDDPKDPQHPAEDLMDALRGGLHALYPEGRRPTPKYHRIQASKIF